MGEMEFGQPVGPQRFFPLLALLLATLATSCQAPNENADKSASIERFLGSYLVAMEELSLEEIPGESYRFIHIPTFGPPLSARVTCHETCAVFARQLSGRGGYEIGELAHKSEREISSKKYREFLGVLESTRFWTETTEAYQLGVGPNDSSIWALEGQKADQRQVWIGWPAEPGEDPGLRSIGLKLLEMSHLEYEMTAYD